MEDFLRNLGPVCAVIGAQWGDEGKGKIVDVLTPHFSVLARASGGANAGHTIVVAGAKHVFHLLPAGCLHEAKILVLGSGMVIHLPTLLEEIRTLEDAGVAIRPRLKISKAAHIVLEEHKQRDAEQERQRAEHGLGTTLRGIGPAYTDKAARTGVRMETLVGGSQVRRFAGSRDKELQQAREILAPCITDAVSLLHQELQAGKRILIEGAQGTLLDIDHGTYPYVTSSSTTAAGALQGVGLPPRCLTSCIGVAKAYCTRVGGGPFPTEASEEDAHRLREKGGEYGATTGRPRRCGWLSLPDLKYAAAVSGITHWNITKLDVLDDLQEIPIGSGEKDGKAIYERLPGWRTSTAGIQSFDRLPEAAQQYLRFIEGQTNIPVTFIGTGPRRDDLIVSYPLSPIPYHLST